MADQWSGGQSGPGERWNVNLPAVIGVVFVFLVGVIVWVVAASASDDDGALPGESVPSVPTSTIAAILTAVPTTTPLPMPSTTLVPPTAAPDRAAADRAADGTDAAPTARADDRGAHRGRRRPWRRHRGADDADSRPDHHRHADDDRASQSASTSACRATRSRSRPCDGGYITVLGSAIGSQATADSMEDVLDQYAGSHYLRTDVTCSSLTPSSNGQPIYVVYYGPFATDREACAARSQGPKDAYVRRLSNDLPPEPLGQLQLTTA